MEGLGKWYKGLTLPVKWTPPCCSWGAVSCSSYSHRDGPSSSSSPPSGSYHPKHQHRHACGRHSQEHTSLNSTTRLRHKGVLGLLNLRSIKTSLKKTEWKHDSWWNGRLQEMWKMRHQNNETRSDSLLLSVSLTPNLLFVCVFVCWCVCACVFKAHTCGMDRRGGACRYRRSLALRWAGSLRFIHLLRQKGALKTPWAEMHIEPPEPPKKQNKNWRDRKQRPDRLSRGRDSVMATELSMNYETTRQSDGTFQLWKRTVMGK